MDDLSKFMYEMCNLWKDHFSLYTYYVGYMTPEMVKTLLILCRYKQMDIFEMLEDGKTTVSEFNDFITRNREYGLKEFRYDKDIDTIMPKIMEKILDYDFCEVDEGKWNQFMEYLDSKSKR